MASPLQKIRLNLGVTLYKRRRKDELRKKTPHTIEREWDRSQTLGEKIHAVRRKKKIM